MVFENWVKNIQAAAYNGARTVFIIEPMFSIKILLLGDCLLTVHRNCFSFSAMCDKIVNWDLNSFASLESLQGFNQQCKIKCIRMVKIVFISGRCFVLLRRKNFVKRIHGQQSYPVNIQTFDDFFGDCCFTTGTATAYSNHKCVNMLT